MEINNILLGISWALSLAFCFQMGVATGMKIAMAQFQTTITGALDSIKGIINGGAKNWFK